MAKYRFPPIVAIVALALLPTPSLCDSNSRLPESAHLTSDSIPYDPSKPRYLLVVDPVRAPSVPIEYHKGYTCDGYNGTPEMLSGALKSRLLSVGNFVVLDEERFFRSNKRFRLATDERGPYIIRALLTEHGTDVEVDSKGVGNIEFAEDDSMPEQLLKFGALIPLFWLGTLTSLPTSWEEELSSSVVALDVSIVDPRSKQVLRSFPVRGTFKTATERVGKRYSSGLYVSEKSESAMEGAIREAFKSAAKQLLDELGRNT